jgi:3-hydroxyisobutyrate dehydrogenase
MKRIGVAGLGLMGTGIAKRLLATGYDVTVYNRTAVKAALFPKVAASPKELAASCELVITAVTDFQAAQQVMLGNEGIVMSGNRSLVVADASTISPEQSRQLAQELRQRAGMEMLGMPVMGGPAAAEAGELVPMVAGNRAEFEKARPVIEKLGRLSYYVGERDGAANALKLALNLNIAMIAMAVSEGMVLARASGIDPALFVQVLNSTYFKTGLSEKKGPRMAAGDFEPSFYLKNMLKDLELATGTAQQAGVAIPVTSTVQQMFRAANNSGYSEMDYTAIFAFLAKINGLATATAAGGGK